MRKFILSIGILITVSAHAGGGTVGNGGNEAALDFLNSAKRMLSIYGSELKTYPQLKGKDLGKVVEKAQILVSSTSLFLEINGIKQESTAVNFKNPLTIVINEKRWANIKEDAIKEALALHELLGLVGVEKTGVYFISKNYLMKNGVICSEGLCENQSALGADETFCRFLNNWQMNDETFKHRFLCKNKKSEFQIYCDLWKDPLEFNGNKIDVFGGTWTPRDDKSGILIYTYPAQGGQVCTLEDTKDE